MNDLQTDIQSRLYELDPEIDLLAVEQPGGDMLRLFIDHPNGVDLALCERVTHHLPDLRVEYALEVSSPGDKYRHLRKSASPSFREQGVVPVSKEIVDAVKALEQEKGISADKLMDALEDALLSAYKKTPGAAKYARVDLDHETGDFLVFELILPPELEEKLLAEAVEQQDEPEVDPETGELKEPEDPELDPEMIAPYEDQITTRDVTPEDFGRIAAQTAKQVILQRIREAERQMMYDEYQDRVGELITGIIQQSDKRYTLVQLRERVEALLPKSEQVYNERYDHGMRVKAVITDVSDSTKGPAIVVSRRSPELIKSLFELEVPEIADRLVEIVGVAREPGYRSKIAVVSHADGVDPVGACVGPRGSRVRMVVSELRGEKIDIIPYNEEPARFVAKALSPARVREVIVDDEERQATVIVPDDQLSLAIGRDGQNARLAARLTGWRVDIKSETEFASEESDVEYEGEETFDGRCMAVLSNGRRCPNAAIPSSTYCGLPQHQALSRFDTSQVAILGDLSDAEVAILADPDADQGQVDEIVARAAANFVEEAEEVAAEESVVDEIVDEAIAEEEAEEAVEDPVEAELAEEVADEVGDRGRRGERTPPRTELRMAPPSRSPRRLSKPSGKEAGSRDRESERHQLERGACRAESRRHPSQSGRLQRRRGRRDAGDRRLQERWRDRHPGAAERGTRAGRRSRRCQAGTRERRSAAAGETGFGRSRRPGPSARAEIVDLEQTGAPRRSRRRQRRWRWRGGQKTPRRDRLAGRPPRPDGRAAAAAPAAPPRWSSPSPAPRGAADGSADPGRARGDQSQLRRHRAGARRGDRPGPGRGDQKTDDDGRDGDAHPDAHR